MDRPIRELLRTIAPHIIILVLFIAISSRAQALNSVDLVAIRTLDGIVDRSINECMEYGGEIKMQPRGFRASPPVRGTIDSVEIPITPPLRTLVAIYHSHGCTSPKYMSEEFSEVDTLNLEYHQYVITPRRRILKFNHVDRLVYELDRRTMRWEHNAAEQLVWSMIP